MKRRLSTTFHVPAKEILLRRLLALIVSRHAARARCVPFPRLPPPAPTQLPSRPHPSIASLCLSLAARRFPSRRRPSERATSFRPRVGRSSGTLDSIACAYPFGRTQTAAGVTWLEIYVGVGRRGNPKILRLLFTIISRDDDSPGSLFSFSSARCLALVRRACWSGAQSESFSLLLPSPDAPSWFNASGTGCTVEFACT